MYLCSNSQRICMYLLILFKEFFKKPFLCKGISATALCKTYIYFLTWTQACWETKNAKRVARAGRVTPVENWRAHHTVFMQFCAA